MKHDSDYGWQHSTGDNSTQRKRMILRYVFSVRKVSTSIAWSLQNSHSGPCEARVSRNGWPAWDSKPGAKATPIDWLRNELRIRIPSRWLPSCSGRGRLPHPLWHVKIGETALLRDAFFIAISLSFVDLEGLPCHRSFPLKTPRSRRQQHQHTRMKFSAFYGVS